VAKGIADLPKDTVIDGEIVALNEKASHHSTCFKASAMPSP
jgi:ATP-dependent DNA ligase